MCEREKFTHRFQNIKTIFKLVKKGRKGLKENYFMQRVKVGTKKMIFKLVEIFWRRVNRKGGNKIIISLY
jgi:hypothetical protein